ncbi:RCC1 domain-containing protein [Marinobacter nauticus]|uniref:RCC1 domain-containing protein n=1 Tax=Marinobacter nauticus TaxID=2743 RepID=UPI000EAF3759|nr:hypothetical protein [Marinobacter nauticus]RKR79624.1 alpha-tubulin suppressor-like RCC1 family protein [Marinobacter nauticus]
MAGSGWDAATAGLGIVVSPDGQTITRPTSDGGGTYAGIKGLAGRSKGKRYYEIDITTGSVGAADAAADVSGMLGGGSAISWGYLNAGSEGELYYQYGAGGGTRATSGAAGAGVYGILLDFDNMTAEIYKDGALQYTETMNAPANTELFPAASIGTGASATLQTEEPFQYPPEKTFIAWDKPDSALGSRVAGLMQIEDVPVKRMLKAFSFERLTFDLDGGSITESKPLGQTISDETTGEYEIILRDGFPREIFLVAFDDYGEDFAANAPIELGERLHPSTPNGHVYECTTAGTLPSEEPVWSTDTSQDQAIGTAAVRPTLFYRPEAHGPIQPEIIEIGLNIQHFRKTLALGATFTACVKPDGTVACWGSNYWGQLDVPAGLTDVVAIACSFYNVYALKSDGTIVAWGYSGNNAKNVPPGLTGVIGVASTGYGGIALIDDGTIVTWGSTSGSTSATDIAQTSGGYDHGLAVTSEGQVVTWGDTGNGKRTVPAGLTEAVLVKAGAEHSLGLGSDGTVYAWGDNSQGQCNVPAGLGGVLDLGGGRFHSIALIDTGEVVGWGGGYYGESSPPAGLGDVVMIDGGYEHVGAVQSDGTIVLWGRSSDGRLDVPAGVKAKV